MRTMQIALADVIEAFGRIVPMSGKASSHTRLRDIGVDSLSLLEVILELESAAGLHIPEEMVRRLSVDVEQIDDMTVADFTAALQGVQASHHSGIDS